MTTPAEPIDENNTLEMQTTEALAFELMSLLHAESAQREQARELWQTSAELRTEWRERAKGLQTALSEGGVRVRAGDRRVLFRQLDWLMTIPPRPAYSVEQEARKTP